MTTQRWLPGKFARAAVARGCDLNHGFPAERGERIKIMELLELSKKYNFKVDAKSLIVPAHISSEDIAWLIDSGYHLAFEFSPLNYIWCERYLNLNQLKKEKEG